MEGDFGLMQQVTDWMFGHAFSIIGGVVLLLAIAGAVVVASKQSAKESRKAVEKKDPREGE